jgi:ABC-type branched-subunit amino acid transport system permease subunit
MVKCYSDVTLTAYWQLPNIIADKIGPLNTIIVIAFITGIVGLSWIAVTGQAGIITFGVVYGFFSGSYVALIAVVWAALSPNPRVLGTRIVCFSWSLGI